MSDGPRFNPFAGLLLVLCPLLCLALPPLLVAGVGAVLTAELGIALAGVGLAALAAGGLLVLRRQRDGDACCVSRERHDPAGDPIGRTTRRPPDLRGAAGRPGTTRTAGRMTQQRV
jgi:hypothetical protein